MAMRNREDDGMITKVVSINRVSKTVKGGRIMKFAALVVVGDGKGTIGYGIGKSGEVPEAIRKGEAAAKKNMHKVAMKGTTIPHEIVGKYGAGAVLLKPAAAGTGMIAGGPVRAVIEAARARLGERGVGTILFLDEVHRFNKSQQDALLPSVEDGLLVLIGATTENPYFEVNAPLLSRSNLFRLELLAPEAVEQLIARLDMNATIPLDTIAYKFDIVLRGRRSTLFENRLEGN